MRSFIKNPRQGGQSLVEAIIYLSLFVLILVVTIEAMVLIAKTYRSIKAAAAIEDAALTIYDRLGRDVRDAAIANTSLSVFGAHPGRLVIDAPRETGTTTSDFYLDGTTLRVRENGIDAGPLTGGRSRITNLVFRQANSGLSKGIKVEITIESSIGETVKSLSFWLTIMMRNSYVSK